MGLSFPAGNVAEVDAEQIEARSCIIFSNVQMVRCDYDNKELARSAGLGTP